MKFEALLKRCREPLAVLGNRNVRRLQVTLLLSEASGPAYATALFIYAYEQGGAGAVGVVGLCVMLPAGLAAPFAGILADQGRRARVVAGAAAARSALLAATALGMLTEQPIAAVILCAALASVPSRIFYPAQIALLPRLVRSESELVAATALGSGVENLGTVAGPALAGAGLYFLAPSAVTAACAVAMLAAACTVVRLDERAGVQDALPSPRGLVGELLAGWTVIARSPALCLIVALYSFQTAIFGVLMVCIVELAVSEFWIGASGVGLLNGSLGAGGIVGGLLALMLSTRVRLGSSLRLGTLLWGCPLVLLAVAPNVLTALGALAVVGIGNVFVDVSCYALIQRAIADEVRGRVFAALEGAGVAAVASGSLVAGALVEGFGVRLTLATAGLSLAISALAAWRALDRLDRNLEPAPEPVFETDSALPLVPP